MLKIDNIEEHLRNNKVNPSFQRIMIMKYLIDNNNHPTVDMIYQELKGTISTLSKTTVYNTLKLLVENKVVNVLNIEDNELRYDADTRVHGHFKCINCGNILDLNIDISKLDIDLLSDIEIKEHHIYFKGYCNCK